MKYSDLRLLVLLLGLFFVSGCRPTVARPAVPPQLLDVSVARPVRGAIEDTITLPGDITGYYQAALYAKVTGYLKSIAVDKGDRVNAGQVLAVIEVPELQQQLDQSKANLEIARITYQRLQSVWKSDPRLVARQDVDIALAKYREAQANADELLSLYNYTKIIAPFAGVITERFVDPGALVHAGGEQRGTGLSSPSGSVSPIVSIARLDKLRIYIYVPQSEADSIRVGLPATIRVDGLGGTTFTGSVTRFAHSLQLSTRTMLTEIDLENAERRLYPGMYAKVTLVLQRHPDALRVPASAVGGSPSQVFVVQNGHLHKIPVAIGISDGRSTEIVAGVGANSLVVQNFSNTLIPGEAVTYNLVDPDAALAMRE